MIIQGNIIISENGFLRRLSDKCIVGTEYSCGYIYYLKGELLPEPHLEIPEDFEDISEDVLWDEMYPPLVNAYIRVKYTISDELAIQRQRDEKLEAFKEYYAYCEECKSKAREEVEKIIDSYKRDTPSSSE